MKKYRRNKAGIRELKKTLHEVAHDILYSQGEYLPPIPQKPTMDIENLSTLLPTSPSKEYIPVKNPLKTMIKKQVLDLIGQNDN